MLLIYRINTDRSVTRTSFQQEWDRPTDKQLGKDIYAHPLVLSKVYIPNNNFANIKPYELSVEDLKDIDCPLRRVLQVEKINQQEILARATSFLSNYNKFMYNQTRKYIYFFTLFL